MKVRDYIQERYPGMDLSVAPLNRDSEFCLINSSPHLNIPTIPQSYRRYGYGLLSYCAKKFIHDWFSDHGTPNGFEGIQAKLTNSGMSAIDLVMHVLTLGGRKRIILPSNSYFVSEELISSYMSRLFDDIITFEAGKEKLEKLVDGCMEDAILYLEIFANSPNMSFWDEVSIRKVSDKVAHVVMDGTLLGISRVAPKILNQRNIIYIESLSKNYHECESSQITSGVVVYPDYLEQAFQTRFFCSGGYLQLNDLLEMPFELYEVGKRRIMSIANHAKNFYGGAKRICEEKGISLSKVADPNNMPVVLFIDFQNKPRLKSFLRESGLETRGSFGHDSTYVLPIGLLWDTSPPGLARITFGSNDDNTKILKALNRIN